MKHSLSIAYITSRLNPEYHWFIQSLLPQKRGRECKLIVVDYYCPKFDKQHGNIHTRPKPTVWQGGSRKTKDDWWAASNARNTAICLCETEWIAFVDDRCVLMPNWLDAVEAAMEGQYAVCGPYEKRTGITVSGAHIQHGGIVTGEDNRLAYVKQHYSNPAHLIKNPYPAPSGWFYGCSVAFPLEWSLSVNGWPEDFCDGLSGEDYCMGCLFENNGYPIKYDTRMAIVEDRTPDRLGKSMIRKDKGVSPKDKSHACLEIFKTAKMSKNSYNIRSLRSLILAGQPFPPPTASDKDWYDGQPLSEM